jgi:hypothetical protein
MMLRVRVEDGDNRDNGIATICRGCLRTCMDEALAVGILPAQDPRVERLPCSDHPPSRTSIPAFHA